MVLREGQSRLALEEVPAPSPSEGQVLVRVSYCAVCRTDLHVVDGDLKNAKLPLIPGHEIVGRIEETGKGVDRFRSGERVGIPWLGFTCGHCRWCQNGRENLCDSAKFTGYTIDGGFAEYAVADQRFVFRLPENYDDLRVAPFLCAGLIGYRSYKMCADAKTIGIYGFGAAAHIIAQLAISEGRRIFAFTRPGDLEAQKLALNLGAIWAGDSDSEPPEKLEAAIIFAPVGALVPHSLKALDRAGILILGGIHMSDIPGFPYRDIWQEKTIKSVANLTRADAEEFLAACEKYLIETIVKEYALSDANDALNDLRTGKLSGAAVLKVEV